jgi:NAD(P)-dependent dehydrogenase (short-subunit alcohol dehydrogenase family)
MTSPYFDLTGKVALVTGGSRGLGYQMAKAFALHGADVIVASRKLDNCEAVAGEIRALGRYRPPDRGHLRGLRAGGHSGEQCRLRPAHGEP